MKWLAALMAPLQLLFIGIAFLLAPVLWLISRRVQSRRMAVGICWFFAIALVGAYVATLYMKYAGGDSFQAAEILPMQLCDWAAFVTLLALMRRSPTAFELAYCWGLAGTAQGLFTPAINISDDPRALPFLIIHAVIPASVFWLMFECKLRPRQGAFFRVMVWSEIYLGLTLLTNHLTNSNYGFLSERPPNPSLLDHYSDTWWIYVLQINLTAVVAFAILLVPWWIADRNGPVRKVDTSVGRGTPDAE